MADNAQTIIDLDRKRMQAMADKDIDTLNALLADDLIYTHSSARLDTKQSLIGNMQSGATVYNAVEPSDVKAQDLGSAVVLTGVARIRVTSGGKPNAFEVRFTARDGSEQYPHATSWGASTRLVGGVVMAHGDDRGLRLPPRVAPQQVVIVPIVRDDERAAVLEAAASLAGELRAAGVRVRVDDRPEHRPGFKFNEWELKGVPLRLEIGGRDLAAAAVTVARRDTGEKQQIPRSGAATAVDELLKDVQASLFQSASDEQELRTLRSPGTYGEMIEYLRSAAGFVAAPWCGGAECEARVKGESSATIRCLPLEEQSKPSGVCLCCGGSAIADAVWAQAY